MATSVYSDPTIPDNVKMDQMRHKTMKSAGPYVHANRKTQQALQNELSDGLVGAANRYPAEAVLPQLKSQQLSGVIRALTCYPEGKTTVLTEQQVLPQVSQQQIYGVVETAALYPNRKTMVPTAQQMWPQVGQLQLPTHASTFTVPHTHHQQHGGLVAGTHNPNENTSAAPAQHLLQQEQQHRQQQLQHTGPKLSITEHLPLTTLVPHVQNNQQVQAFHPSAVLPQAKQNTLLTYTYSDDENNNDNIIQEKTTVLKKQPSKKRTYDEIAEYEKQLLIQNSWYETLLREHSATISILDEAHRYIEILETSTKVDDVQHLLNQKTAIIHQMGQLQSYDSIRLALLSFSLSLYSNRTMIKSDV